MLAWTKWGQRGLNIDSNVSNPEDVLFTYFIEHFNNKGSHPYYGIEWFFDGSYYKAGDSGWAQPDSGSGNRLGLSAADYRGYVSFDDQPQDAMAFLTSTLQNGEAVSLGIDEASAHALTCWGYSCRDDTDTSDPAYYTGLIVSDSDNSKYLTPAPDDMIHVPLSWSEAESRYYLGGSYGNQYYLTDGTTLARQFSNGDPLVHYGWMSGSPTEVSLIGYLAEISDACGMDGANMA